MSLAQSCYKQVILFLIIYPLEIIIQLVWAVSLN